MSVMKNIAKCITEGMGALKDEAVSTILEKVIAEKLGKYAEILSVDIDSEGKTIKVFARSWKEKKEYSIRINGYQLVSTEEENFVSFQSISASENFINELFNNKRVIIPEKYSGCFKSMKKIL